MTQETLNITNNREKLIIVTDSTVSNGWTSQVAKGELYDNFMTNFTDNWKGIVGTFWSGNLQGQQHLSNYINDTS